MVDWPGVGGLVRPPLPRPRMGCVLAFQMQEFRRDRLQLFRLWRVSGGCDGELAGAGGFLSCEAVTKVAGEDFG